MNLSPTQGLIWLMAAGLLGEASAQAQEASSEAVAPAPVQLEMYRPPQRAKTMTPTETELVTAIAFAGVKSVDAQGTFELRAQKVADIAEKAKAAGYALQVVGVGGGKSNLLVKLRKFVKSPELNEAIELEALREASKGKIQFEATAVAPIVI